MNAPQIQLLGGCELRDPAGELVMMQTRKSWGLLAYLCQAQGRDVPREELAALLWSRGNERQARSSLRQELAVLRKALTRAQILGLAASKDRVRFEPRGGDVDSILAEHLLDRREDRVALRGAVQLYKGDFLPDLNLPSAPFEEWLWLERQRLKNRILNALQNLLEHDLGGKDTDRAIATARTLMAIDPTQELAYRAQMRLLHRLGRRAEALQLYRQCADILRRELDAGPSLETTMLADRIRTDTGQVPGAAAKGTSERLDLAVLCLALVGPDDYEILHDPVTLKQAHKRLFQRAQRVAAACGGLVLPGLGDRIVAVFGYPASSPDFCESAVHAGLSLVEEPVGLSQHRALWPRAGIAVGDMMITLPGAGRSGAELAGEALLQANGLLHVARAGQVVVANGVPAYLNDQYITKPVVQTSAGLHNRGRVVHRSPPPRDDQPA